MNSNERILRVINQYGALTEKQICCILDDMSKQEISARLCVLLDAKIVDKTIGIEPKYYSQNYSLIV